MLMQKAKDPAFWLQVRQNPTYREILDLIRGYYQSSRQNPISALSYRARARFYDDGDRAEFERPYFARRTYLSSAALLALIYPEEPQYLADVQEVLWAICDEYSWCLPAHCDGTLKDDLTRVDLFNAETGFALAELCDLLEDRLDKLVLDRARAEVRKRVIESYRNRTFRWETNKANWAAVCAGNVGGAMLYLEPTEFERQLPRLLQTMRCFISGFPEDGTCMEGFGYWHYGFGNFLWFADLLYQYTDGKTDLLTWDKVETVAGYTQRSFLHGDTTVSYGDGVTDGKVDRAVLSYLHLRFPDSVQMLPRTHTVYSKGNVTWMQTLRNLLYAEHHSVNVDFRLQDVFLPGAQQAVLHRKGYSLAVKAGHNHEPHGHNDVGSFILSTDKGQIFCDLGAGLYTRQYFQPETRYDYFCNNSFSHSVPIVNGAGQKHGDAYNGTISLDGNVVTVEFANAYGQESITKLNRSITCENGSVTICDAFEPNYESLCERFVTLHKPDVFADHVVISGVTLSFDPETMTLSVKEEIHLPHNASLPPQTVYCIDFDLRPGLSGVQFIINVPEV